MAVDPATQPRSDTSPIFNTCAEGWWNMVSGRHDILVRFCWLVISIAPMLIGQPRPAHAQPVPPPDPGLILTEIAPVSTADQPAWLEMHNASGSDVHLDQITLSTSIRRDILSDDQHLELEPNQRVVVCFAKDKAQEVRERCPATQLTVLVDSSIAASWNAARGQASIIRRLSGDPTRQRIVDQVTWGGPYSRPNHEIGFHVIHGNRPWVALSESTGMDDPDARLQLGESIGLLPQTRASAERHWAVFRATEATPGEPNRIPAPRRFFPPDGTEVRMQDAAIAWVSLPGGGITRVQVSPDDSFGPETKTLTIPGTSAPLVRLADLDLEKGTHYYRARRDLGDDEEGWSRWMSISLIKIKIPPRRIKEVGGVRYAYQRKDTAMLCIEPCFEEKRLNCGCGLRHWDIWHLPDSAAVEEQQSASDPDIKPEDPPSPWICNPASTHRDFAIAPNWGDHGANNCVRASISMIASAYGACLSQDRIAYQELLIYQKSNPEPEDPLVPFPSPESDLLHGQQTNYCHLPKGGSCTKLLKWVFSLSPNLPPTFRILEPKRLFKFRDIENFVEQHQPIMSRWDETTHMRVIDATYRSWFRGDWVRVLDPKLGAPQWERHHEHEWATNSNRAWICPPVGMVSGNVAADEEEIWLDTDGDGMVDFDEKNRFFTDHEKPDSDGDGVPDKADVASYVFHPNPCGSSIDPDCSPADFDNDGSRKELDPDNDNDGCLDGREERTYYQSAFNSLDCHRYWSVLPVILPP